MLKTGKPVIVVLSAGSAVALSGGNALVHTWYPGQAGGTALANILFGAVSPSGRLPLTFYNSVDDLPPFEDYAMKNRTYRYFEGEALYPFGYGLSYTKFAYADAVYQNGAVNVTVKNTGAMEADEVVQGYVKDLDSPYAVANHSLAAFKRVHLGAGEAKAVTLPVDPKAFHAIGDDGKPTSLGKRFTLYIGGSQPDARSVALAGQASLALHIEI